MNTETQDAGKASLNLYLLRQRITELAGQHGSIRAAARVLGVTGGYLCRLRDGEKTNPSPALLRKMKLRRIVTVLYERAT